MNDYVKTLRQSIGSSLIHLPGVRALIFNDHGEILLQRRTDMAFWSLPAGAVEIGESALEALQREVAEETALQVITAEPMALYSGPNQRFRHPNGDEVQPFSIAFIVRKWQNQPRADGGEGSEVRFFPLTQLPDNLVPIHQHTIQDYENYNGSFIIS